MRQKPAGEKEHQCLCTWFCTTQLTLTIRIHLIRDRPNPEMAPYRPAAEVVRQKDRKNPIQLKRNATEKGEKSSKSRHLYIPRKKKTINPLHTDFSWCYTNINVTQTILGHCLKESSFHQVLTEESQHENAIISYPQLVSVIKVISCHKVIILQGTGSSTGGI